jgi:hypothetical protein
VLSTIAALAEERGDTAKIWGSMVKQTLKRRRPGFSESQVGFRAFGELLVAMQERGLIKLNNDDRSRGILIESWHDTEAQPAEAEAEVDDA